MSVINEKRVIRALKVGRIAHARYIPVGRVLPFLSQGDNVFAEAVTWYDTNGKVVTWQMTLTNMDKGNPAHVEQFQKQLAMSKKRKHNGDKKRTSKTKSRN